MDKETLIDEIKKHNKLYWQDNNPEISDEAYDKLIMKLRELDPNHELLSYVGTKNNKTPVLLSLNKAYSVNELKDWAKKVARDQNEVFLLQPKYNGWATYYDVKNLISRGGENLNDKIPLIKIVTNNHIGSLKYYTKPVHGEIVLTKENFEKLNSKYKTPLNALAGILSRDDMLYDWECLHLIDYNLYSNEFMFKNIDNIDWDMVHKELKKWTYPTDGIVIKLKDKEYSESLGYTSHHPRGQIAFKDKNPSGISRLINVEWFVGKNNIITPVGIVEPVEILQHTIQKASLHNMAEIRRLDIKIGDDVIIERTGEIVPKIIKAIPGKERKEIIISYCPSCQENITDDDGIIKCTGQFCMGSLTKKLTDSFKRLGLENIGPAITDKLINYCDVEKVTDIFKLEKNDFYSIPNFKDKSVFNIYNEIANLKNNPIDDWKVLAALNIPNIGRSIAKKLLTNHNLQELIDMDYEELCKLDSIGPERAGLLYDGLYNNEDLDYFLENFKIKESKQKGNIKQRKVCFTGKMPEVRSYYEKLAENNNYIPTNSVSKDLDLLVAMDINDNRGKLSKARKLGINIITLKEFLNECS